MQVGHSRLDIETGWQFGAAASTLWLTYMYMQFDQYDYIIIWECYLFSVVTDHMLSLHDTYEQTVLSRWQLHNNYNSCYT